MKDKEFTIPRAQGDMTFEDVLSGTGAAKASSQTQNQSRNGRLDAVAGLGAFECELNGLDGAADSSYQAQAVGLTQEEYQRPAKRKGRRIAVAIVCILAVCGIGYGLFAYFAAPKQQYATVKVDGAAVSYQELKRGDAVTVTGEQGDYYRVSYKGTELLVEKTRVRRNTDTQPEAWQGYALGETPVYASGYLTGNTLGSLQAQQAVSVVDSFANVAYIETSEGLKGYVALETLSKTDPSQTQSGSYSYYYYYYEDDDDSSYEEDSGGYVEPTPSPEPAPEVGNDGDDIQLIDYEGYASAAPAMFYLDARENVVSEPGTDDSERYFRQVNDAKNDGGSAGSSNAAAGAGQNDVTSSASSNGGTILCDGCMTYLVFLSRGDTVKVVGDVSSNQDEVTVDINGVEGQIKRSHVRLESEDEYAVYDGYALAGAYYSDLALTAEAGKWNMNDVVKVVDEINGVLLIQTESGYVYAPLSMVAKTMQEVVVSNSAGESSGGSTSNGNAGYAGGNDDGDDSSSSATQEDTGATSDSSEGQAEPQQPVQDWTQKKL